MSMRSAALLLLLSLTVVGGVRAENRDVCMNDPWNCPHTDPDQGGDAFPVGNGLPDLTPDATNLPGMAIGGVFASWNGAVILSEASASARSNGRCAFSFLYFTRNIGVNVSNSTTNGLYRIGNGVTLLAASPLPALWPSNSQASNGTIWLSPGTSTLMVYADASQSVYEANERNNQRQIQVTVTGDCY